ncbi:MAG: hypothetical protein IPK55_10845 [Streptococcus sp.]|nr:hypothetical protein [Streptococcus sp.]
MKDDIYDYPTEDLKKGIETSLKDWYAKMGIEKSDSEINKIAEERVKPYKKRPM